MRTVRKIFMQRMELQILVAIVLALVVGLYLPDLAKEGAFLGTLYLNLLKFIIAPLLFFSIISSIVGIGSIKELGRLGGMTFSIYMLTTFLAIMLSLVMMNLFTPGLGFDLSGASFEAKATSPLSLQSFLLSLVPKNIISPFLESNMMQLVFISIMFALAILSLSEHDTRLRLYESAQAVTDVVLKFTSWIIALTPIGIFGLIAPIIAKYGLAPLWELKGFVFVVLGSLFIHLLVTLPLLAFILVRINVYRFLLKLKHVILFAFSTASSSATLPLNLVETVRLGGVKKRIAELVLPIGSTINMDGTALYQAAVALFVAQATGVDMSVGMQATIVITVILASVGAAGIPGAGIVMLTTVFASIGLPLEAIGVIMLVDRILDMFRTAVNVSGDMIVTKIINSKYEKDIKTGVCKSSKT